MIKCEQNICFCLGKKKFADRGGECLLINLHVKNLAIIDEIDVYFSEHLNVLTGETGAGKSIIIGSINIALGAKVSSDIIRKGADYALVELVFQVDERTIIDILQVIDIPIIEGQVIITRKVLNGRSICKMNGETVTITTLREVAGILMDIHGQHEHQSLLYKKNHLDIIDHFSKNDIKLIKDKIATRYCDYLSLKKEVDEASISEDERMREISFLEYEINEIQSARLQPKEDEELETQYKKLQNSNTIMEGLSSVYEITGESQFSLSDNIGRAVRTLNKLVEYDDEIQTFSIQLSDIENLMNDFNRELSDYMSEFNYDPHVFQEVEERLNLIHNLKAKYGNTLEDIMKYYNIALDKLDRYKDYDMYFTSIQSKLKKLEEDLLVECNKLSKLRKKNAKLLEEQILKALLDLNFLDVRFAINFNKLNNITGNGYDETEFLIATNPGEDVKPLSKVASGGELSRIMLAIKSVLAEHDHINTLIFDEIDVGVSGRTAQKVSEKLSLIAKNHQIICITHLPQIAAMADEHYIIEKSTNNITTQTTIRKLDQEESANEIARILGGAKITDTILTSAKEMKELAANTKKF